MKITVKYTIEYKKEIEITPEEYCQLYANSDSKCKNFSFPENSFNRDVPRYDDMTEDAQIEMDKFWRNR